MSKRCVICLAEEDDGREYVQETYCKRCLATDVGILRGIHLRSLQDKRRGLENLGKDPQVPQ